MYYKSSVILNHILYMTISAIIIYITKYLLPLKLSLKVMDIYKQCKHNNISTQITNINYIRIRSFYFFVPGMLSLFKENTIFDGIAKYKTS